MPISEQIDQEGEQKSNLTYLKVFRLTAIRSRRLKVIHDGRSSFVVAGLSKLSWEEGRQLVGGERERKQ